MTSSGNIWEKLWDYDPNALLAVDDNLQIKIVNSSFVKMFKLEKSDVIGMYLYDFFEDLDDFYTIIEKKSGIIKKIREYRNGTLVCSEVTFRIEEEKLNIKIFHDITDQERKEKEMRNLKIQVIDEVQKIVDKQMKVGQEIASILGETTAETKSTLVKMLSILKKEN